VSVQGRGRFIIVLNDDQADALVEACKLRLTDLLSLLGTGPSEKINALRSVVQVIEQAQQSDLRI